MKTATKSQLWNSEYHLKPAEIKKVIYAAKIFRDRCMPKALAQTGIRRPEVANLDIRDIDFAKRLVHSREGKGGKSRTVPITDELASDLKHFDRRAKNRSGLRLEQGWPASTKVGELGCGKSR